MSLSPPSPLGGELLQGGKYQLLAILGRGGMADVYLAVARGPAGMRKLVVVKRLRPNLAGEDSFRGMFVDEARLSLRLQHKNVVQTFEIVEHGDDYLIAMEYLEGQGVNTLVRRASRTGVPVPRPIALRIADEALAGLVYAHELTDFDGTPLGITHRDVSPHNIFVTYDGEVKLVDFGVAKATFNSVQTEAGTLKGKLAYMAPEQARGERVDGRADLFSMTVVTWELLTSKKLFQAESAPETLLRVANMPVPPISELCEGATDALCEFIAKGLARDAGQRFASAREMRGALAALGEEMASADEVGAWLSTEFALEKERLRASVQEFLGRPLPASYPEAASLSKLSLTSVPPGKDSPTDSVQGALQPLPGASAFAGTGSGSGALPAVSISSIPGGDDAGGTQPTRIIPSVPPAVPSRARTWVVGGTVVALLGASLAGAFFAGRRGSADAAGRSPPPASPSPAPPVASLSPALTPPLESAVPSPAASSTEAASAPAVPSPPPPVPPPAATKGGRPTGVTPRVAAAPTSASPSASAEAGGFLNLDSYPWTNVSESGTPLGQTPLVHVPLAAGKHTLVLENPDQGLKQTATVDIPSGATLSRRIGLK